MVETFEEQLVSISRIIKPEGYGLDDATIPLAVNALEEIDVKYGPDSDDPHPYHNAQHGIDVIRRGVRLTNILYPYLRSDHRPKIFDLDFAIGSWHDIEQSLVAPGANERASARSAVRAVSQLEGPLNNKKFKHRLELGIIATTAAEAEDGKITQPYVKKDAHDPVKLIAAYADINGVAMEGPARMLKDATNLALEIFGEEPTKDEFGNFLVSQAGFLTQRLNDGQVKSDLAYYFSKDEVDAIYKDTRKIFHPNIDAAVKIARAMQSRPELQGAMYRALNALSPEQIRSNGGKLLRRVARLH